MPKTKPFIFLDSSVLFSAIKSELGGSFRLLQECERATFQPIISQRVIKEVQLNLQEKYPQFLPQFYHLLVQIDFKIVNPTLSLIKKCQKIINPQDAIILAAALKAKVNYLITLDKKHFITDKQITKKAQIKILTPQDFLNEMRRKGLIN